MLFGANLILGDHTMEMAAVAPMIEASGLDALFVGEHTHIPVATVHPAHRDGVPEFYKRFLDPFVQLAVAATVTDRIRLGTGVVLVAERNPLELAKAVASLDVISRGRVEVGVGYGWNPLEMANNGVNPALRRQVFREKLTAVKQLWTEETVAFDGRWVHFTESWSFPKPLQHPHPPILLGAAASDATFDDVLTLADGWYPLGADDLPEQVHRLAARAGGTGPPVTVVEMEGQRPGVPWYAEEDGRAAILGERARRYADCGVHRLSVGVPADEPDRLSRALDVLASLTEAVA
jgi:probable F420-dependent oxidoreductase